MYFGSFYPFIPLIFRTIRERLKKELVKKDIDKLRNYIQDGKTIVSIFGLITKAGNMLDEMKDKTYYEVEPYRIISRKIKSWKGKLDTILVVWFTTKKKLNYFKR